MKSPLSCIGIVVLLVGCSSNAPPPDSIPEDVLLENQSIRVSNQERQYHLYLPVDPGAAPIVILLHGNGGSNDQILGLDGSRAPHGVWLDIARQENVILAVPNGTVGPNGRRGWNDCRNDAPTNPESDDVHFISELIDLVQSLYGSDTSAVYSVGTSNGGLMSMRLAAEIPRRMEAIAFIVASKPVNTECLESMTPVSVLIMNGTDDPILPYDGGQIGSNRGVVFSTAQTVRYWTDRNRSDTTPDAVDIADSDPDDDSTVRRYSYRNGTDDTVVEHYEIVGGGHTEPSIAERYGNLFKLIVGNQNGDIEMATVIWTFFDSP